MAQAASASLKGIAVALANGSELDSGQKSVLSAFQKKFGAESGTARNLNAVAGRLDKIANKIGAPGEGVKVIFARSTGAAIARAWRNGSSIKVGPRFFAGMEATGGISQASALFHEVGHSTGLRDQRLPSGAPPGLGRFAEGAWRAYGVGATDWLGANDPERARKNNDSYHCFVMPLCGGP